MITLVDTSIKLDKVKQVQLFLGHPDRIRDTVRIEMLNGDVIELKADWKTATRKLESDRTDESCNT